MAVENTMRQLNLLLVLLNTARPLTRAEIFKRVSGYGSTDNEAAQRKFERDKSDLREYLVFNEVGADGDQQSTYSIDLAKSFMADIDLNQDERILISLAIKAWRDAHLGQSASAGSTIAGPEYRGGSNVFAAIGDNERHLSTLKEAIVQKRIVQFNYYSKSSNETKTRIVEPWRLVLHQEHWYLFGFDYAREDGLLFRLTRIYGDVVVTKDEILNPSPQDVNPIEIFQDFQRTEDQVQTAKVRVPVADCANLRLLAKDYVETEAGDVLTIEYDDAYALSREIALVCDRAQILEPTSLLVEVTNVINQVLAVHE